MWSHYTTLARANNKSTHCPIPTHVGCNNAKFGIRRCLNRKQLTAPLLIFDVGLNGPITFRQVPVDNHLVLPDDIDIFTDA
jgi:hypothetical protein